MAKAKHPLFRRWTGIRQMLLNPNDKHYPLYHKLECEGLHDFDSFVEFVENEIGPIPDKTSVLNRIDQYRGWVKGNIRWCNYREMCNNRRYHIRIKFQGRTLTLSDWAQEVGISYATLISRYEKKWPVRRMLTEPADTRFNHYGT